MFISFQFHFHLKLNQIHRRAVDGIHWNFDAVRLQVYNCLLCLYYSGDLKSGQVWILSAQKEVGLHMVWISNGICIPEAQTFEIQVNGCHLVKNHSKSGPNVQIWNGTLFKWLRL